MRPIRDATRLTRIHEAARHMTTLLGIYIDARYDDTDMLRDRPRSLRAPSAKHLARADGIREPPLAFLPRPSAPLGASILSPATIIYIARCALSPKSFYFVERF